MQVSEQYPIVVQIPLTCYWPTPDWASPAFTAKGLTGSNLLEGLTDYPARCPLLADNLHSLGSYTNSLETCSLSLNSHNPSLRFCFPITVHLSVFKFLFPSLVAYDALDEEMNEIKGTKK